MKNITIPKTVLTGLLLCLFVFTAKAQDSAQVAMSNYCIITTTSNATIAGTMIENQNGKVKVIDPVLGELNIELIKIVSMKVVETNKDYTFKMSNGRKYYGLAVNQNQSVITIKTETLGEMKLMTSSIVDFASGDKAVGSDTEVYDHASRYLLAPSAIPLRKGEGYYQNIYVLMNGVQYGVTDNFSVGGGIIAPIGFFATAKYGVKMGPKVHVAAGGMFVTTLFGMGYGVGCGFGSLTYGNRGTNFTVTAGYGAIGGGGDWAMTQRPILNISGMLKLSEGVSLVTENWLIPTRQYNYNYNYSTGYGEPTVTHTYKPQVSAGIRLGAGHHSFDIAGLAIGGEIVIPYFAYAYRFNSKKK